MSATRDFKETAQVQIVLDPTVRKDLLKKRVGCVIASDMDASEVVLRDYVSARIGFHELGALTAKSPKGLMSTFPETVTLRPDNCLRSLAASRNARDITCKSKLFDQR